MKALNRSGFAKIVTLLVLFAGSMAQAETYAFDCGTDFNFGRDIKITVMTSRESAILTIDSDKFMGSLSTRDTRSFNVDFYGQTTSKDRYAIVRKAHFIADRIMLGGSETNVYLNGGSTVVCKRMN